MMDNSNLVFPNVPPPPAVSILLPVYNAETTLHDCLDTIFSQSFNDYEVIAINDGSEDDSQLLLNAWANRDKRLRIVNTCHRGLVSALNTGLSLARAPLIARMDADDLMNPSRLERQIRTMGENPHLDLLASQARIIPIESVTAGLQEYMRWQNNCLTHEEIHSEIYWESPLVHPTVMFRRQRVLGLGGYRQGDFPEDYDLWLRMVQAGCLMAKLPEVLLDWRDGPTRLTRSDGRYGRQAFARLRLSYLARDTRLPKDRPIWCWGAGRRARQQVVQLARLGVKISGWIDIDPMKTGRLLHGAPVYPPTVLETSIRPFLLCMVTNHGARDLIAGHLHRLGYQAGQDYFMTG
ncbi:MAG: glycosyltransferase [Magnetococcales bacterium]|nr:glycosyltransferase [Magnetococcales bacterium]NGZ26696.1 glycosyltransferase [Magnetococcales bacterium]